MTLFRRSLFLPLLAGIAGCAMMAVQTAPSKQASTERSPLALQADRIFWQTLHDGDYAGIDSALKLQTAAYLQNPNDAVTAAHVGFLHIWRLSERARLADVPATITDDAVLAGRYFQEAVALDPSDPRFLGFLGASRLSEGNIHKDEKLTRQGYYTLRDSIDAWPSFNYFTAGYVMSGQPADSPRFKEALEWQWKTLDVCTGGRFDRSRPDYAGFMAIPADERLRRACTNGWIAPHNFEGFFLNMGDMLVKAGDWQTAVPIYRNARLSATYDQWKFAPVLEARIENAQANVAVFNAPRGTPPGPTRMMFDSPFACMACHQK